MKRLTFILFFSTYYINVFASDIVFENVSLRGSGCSNDSQVVFSPESKTVSILYGNFISEVPNFSRDDDSPSTSYNEKLNYRVCDIVLTALIPSDQRVDSFSINVNNRGAVIVSPHSSASIKTMMMSWKSVGSSYGGRREVVAEKKWNSFYSPVTYDEDFFLNASKKFLIRGNNCSSAPKRRFEVVIKTIVMSQIRSDVALNDSFSMLMVDSSDINSGIKVSFETHPCPGNSSSNRNSSRGSQRYSGSNQSRGSHSHGRGQSYHSRHGGEQRFCRGGRVFDVQTQRCVRKI